MTCLTGYMNVIATTNQSCLGFEDLYIYLWMHRLPRSDGYAYFLDCYPPYLKCNIGSLYRDLLLAWIRNYILYNVWDEITDPSPNFNSAPVEVWEWISNFILHFTGHIIMYPCRDQNWVLVKGAKYTARYSQKNNSYHNCGSEIWVSFVSVICESKVWFMFHLCNWRTFFMKHSLWLLWYDFTYMITFWSYLIVSSHINPIVFYRTQARWSGILVQLSLE